MLIPKFRIEHILELLQCDVTVSRNCNGLSLISGGVDFDKVLKLVIVDIIFCEFESELMPSAAATEI